MFHHFGCCRSGRRWFWVIEEDCRYKPYEEWPHQCGWEDTKEQALATVRKVIESINGRNLSGPWAYAASNRLKQINKAKRGGTPRMANNGEPIEYLFSRVGYTSDQNSTYRSWVLAFPVVRKTAARIYYDKRGREWPHREDGYKSSCWHDDEIGFVDREEIETKGYARKRGRHFTADDYELHLTPPL